jgi:hypothetical protein
MRNRSSQLLDYAPCVHRTNATFVPGDAIFEPCRATLAADKAILVSDKVILVRDGPIVESSEATLVPYGAMLMPS